MVGKLIFSFLMLFVKAFFYCFGVVIYLARFSIPIMVLFGIFYFVIGTWNIGLWTVEARGIFAVFVILIIYGTLEQIKNEEEQK